MANSGPRRDFCVEFVGDEMTIKLMGHQATLSFEQWEKLHRRMSAAWYCRLEAREREDSERKQSYRWLLDMHGAEYRSGRRVVRATLKRVTPRRQWECATCRRPIDKGVRHWRGVDFVDGSGCEVREPGHHRRGKTPPRFCDQ